MSLQLQDIIQACRDRHPAFDRWRVTNPFFARVLTAKQRDLVSKALERNRQFLAQQASIVFAESTSNDVGTVGAGTAGGEPGTVTNNAITGTTGPVGDAVTLDPTSIVYKVTPLAVASATATTVTPTGSPAWTTNAFVNLYVEIVAGTGATQGPRQVGSNTAGTITLASGQAWAQTPDTTSIMVVYSANVIAAGDFGVVADMPADIQRLGYLVRLNAQGQPFIDLTQPLVAQFAQGIQLPPVKHIIGGTVRFQQTAGTTNPAFADLTLVPYTDRLKTMGANARYAAYFLNGQLFLIGNKNDWAQVVSVDMRYVPEPPVLVSLTDYFLVPDSAYGALVEHAAYKAAIRVSATEGAPPIDISPFRSDAMEAEEQWLREVGQVRTAFTSSVREVW